MARDIILINSPFFLHTCTNAGGNILLLGVGLTYESYGMTQYNNGILCHTPDRSKPNGYFTVENSDRMVGRSRKNGSVALSHSVFFF